MGTAMLRDLMRPGAGADDDHMAAQPEDRDEAQPLTRNAQIRFDREPNRHDRQQETRDLDVPGELGLLEIMRQTQREEAERGIESIGDFLDRVQAVGNDPAAEAGEAEQKGDARYRPADRGTTPDIAPLGRPDMGERERQTIGTRIGHSTPPEGDAISHILSAVRVKQFAHRSTALVACVAYGAIIFAASGLDLINP